MKTSSSQFDLMVTFMEQHGDLSKPCYNARDRIASLKNWEELAQLLNSDGSGDTKSTEKWKKVWSDYKNNTKKKATRLHKAAKGTGGGPAIHGKLTDLEQRVLNLISVQATGLAVEEAGLSQGIYVQGNLIENIEQGSSQPGQENVASLPQLSLPRAISSPSLAFAKEEFQSSQSCNDPGSSRHPHVAPAKTLATPLISYVEVKVENTDMLSPTMPLSQDQEIQPGPALSGQTASRRARPIRTWGSHRRRVRPAHTEQAAQLFLQIQEHWRNLKSQQHQDFMDLKREQNRIRELEVQAQREWQALGLRALDILDKLVNKYCKD